MKYVERALKFFQRGWRERRWDLIVIAFYSALVGLVLVIILAYINNRSPAWVDSLILELRQTTDISKGLLVLLFAVPLATMLLLPTVQRMRMSRAAHNRAASVQTCSDALMCIADLTDSLKALEAASSSQSSRSRRDKFKVLVDRGWLETNLYGPADKQAREDFKQATRHLLELLKRGEVTFNLFPTLVMFCRSLLTETDTIKLGFTDPTCGTTLQARQPIVCTGAYSLPSEATLTNIHVWIILQDEREDYFLQHPPAVLNSDGQWVAENIIPGPRITKIMAVQVSQWGDIAFRERVSRSEWGGFLDLPRGAQILATVDISTRELAVPAHKHGGKIP